MSLRLWVTSTYAMGVKTFLSMPKFGYVQIQDKLS